jgi:hypothetical protein
MSSPVRFPFGLSTAKKNTTFGEYGNPSPRVYHEDFDDFNRFAAAEWTITRVGTTPTEALADEAFGILLLSTVASASSSTFLQKVGASFLPVAGKELWFSSRFKVSDASDTAFAFGLQVTDTSPLDVTDGIYFLKAAASTSVSLVCRKNATTGSVTQAAVATIASDTYVELGFHYNGKATVNVFVNNANVADLSLGSTATDFLPDTALRLSFGVQNGASTARTCSIDNVYAAIQR